MPVSNAEFYAQCADQGVLFKYGALKHPGFDPIWSLVQSAGRVLRQNPGEPLATRTIEGDQWSDDTAASVLQRIINDSVETPEIPDCMPAFHCNGCKSIGLCGDAERAFGQTIQHLSEQAGKPEEDRSFSSFGCQIFTHRGEPVLLRKSGLVMSAMSLVEIAINGVRYPRGSICGLETAAETAAGRQHVNSQEMRVMDVRGIARIAFGRMSIFALRPDERYQYHGALVKESDYEGDAAQLWNWMNNVAFDEIRSDIKTLAA